MGIRKPLRGCAVGAGVGVDTGVSVTGRAGPRPHGGGTGERGRAAAAGGMWSVDRSERAGLAALTCRGQAAAQIDVQARHEPEARRHAKRSYRRRHDEKTNTPTLTFP
ncbi:hypothetical protein GCM10010400_19630 [Streptomyces aculeolatus]